MHVYGRGVRPKAVSRPLRFLFAPLLAKRRRRHPPASTRKEAIFLEAAGTPHILLGPSTGSTSVSSVVLCRVDVCALLSSTSHLRNMANRGPSYGLSAQVANKLAGKRDAELEQECLAWIEAILGQRLPAGPYEEILRDGQVLCQLMNKLMPGCIQKINTQGGQFKMMENINKFQEMAKKFGVPEIDVFQTVDLWERRNIPQVTQCITALGRTCQLYPDFRGPCLGPKPSEENKRQFTDEQLRAGEGVINLQYGTNKGANASGMNFGNTRHM